ncbi:MAG: sodium:proton antiporter [Alphaproteobacteria bacterium]|nr:sodium:proton antiporter [Alphaproteobacteria bacterium]
MDTGIDTILANTLDLLVVAILVGVLARRLKLPYTVGLVVAGMGLAFFRIDTHVALTHDIIFDIILPPLLFEAALNIHWSELRRDDAPILVLSIFGVAISAAVVCAGMALILNWPLPAALVFGVLIAATDPVAVIAMFKDLGMGGRLRLLVETESLFNDGVAAVFFGLALSWAQGHASGAGTALADLVRISGGGIIVGAVVGGAALTIAGRTNDHLIETALTCVAAYGAFLLAEHFHLSGVLATVTAGLLMGGVGVRGEGLHWGLSRQARAFALEFWEFMAFLANSMVFLLIGLAVGRIHFEDVGYVALGVAIVLVLLGRAATVFPLSALFLRTHWRIPAPLQCVLWWGGLRGALALALSLSLPADLPMRDGVVIATFAVVAFSVVVQGLTMPTLLKFLGLRNA